MKLYCIVHCNFDKILIQFRHIFNEIIRSLKIAYLPTFKKLIDGS